jgi:predicted ester cyclase
LIAEGDKVVWRWVSRGKHSGALQGMPATGKEFALQGISIVWLEVGQFAEN